MRRGRTNRTSRGKPQIVTHRENLGEGSKAEENPRKAKNHLEQRILRCIQALIGASIRFDIILQARA